jgi:hypothetical protein
LAGRVVKRRRLLLLVPNPATRPLGYERVRQLVSEQLEIALPAADVCPACDAFYFDDRHRPVPVLLDGKSTAVQPFIDYLLGVDHTEQTRT